MLFAPGKTPGTRAAVTAPQPGSLDEALRTLRQTMLDASATPPCMTFPAEQKNSVEGTFQVIRKSDGSVALEFLLLTGDLKDVRSTDVTNTITINFKAVGSYDPVTRQVINRDGNWSLRNRDGLILKLKTDGSMEREAPLPADATKQD